MINVILADDHKIIRDGIKAILAAQPAITVVGEASNGLQILEVLNQVKADVVLMDLNMPVMDGFEAIGHIRGQYPQVKVVALSMLDNENYVNQIMDAGAMGYILKTTDTHELVFGLQRAAQGIRFICSEISLGLLRRNKDLQQHTLPATVTDAADKTNGELSKRETEVLHFIAQGFTNAEIAEKLFTSRRTIESHRQNLLDKTGTKNTATLIVYGISRGLIKTGASADAQAGNNQSPA